MILSAFLKKDVMLANKLHVYVFFEEPRGKPFGNDHALAHIINVML
jgi:hypothetical protein